ncbi:MAG TPA: class I SAM-dependent methyltransferase [Spirochaetota bacterium]|nr:class I SAM-dependent methyltransferase [Spirochaetota bacterium]
MNEKGTEFRGFFGGAGYDRLANVMGMGPSYYDAAIGELNIPEGAEVLDLGCGTGSLGIALAKRYGAVSQVRGVDISDDQLRHARNKSEEVSCPFSFYNCSMDELDFPDSTFDVVVTSMALHETPSAVRRGAIREVSRVLKTGGVFVLIEWSRPRFGLLGMLWLPFLFFGDWRDNWNNRYAELCLEQGLSREHDSYINSLARRQVFVKK